MIRLSGAVPQPLTVIVPLYREEEGVAPLARRMRGWLAEEVGGREVDLVLVDDGSDDRTHELLLREFEGLPATVLRHPANRGLSAALATGLESARGALVGWLDSDLTYDPALLLALADEVDAGADLALASCYHPDGGVDGVPRWRLWLSSLASRGYRTATGVPLHTFTSMVRVYRRDLLASCASPEPGFLGVTDVLLRALAGGHRAVEVPAILRRRRVGQSKMRIVRVGLGHLRLMAAARRGFAD